MAAERFTGMNPVVPVYKNGHVIYCHNQKELDKWTKPVEDGGPGYVTEYTHQEWPKLMSHPEHPNVKVNNKKEQAEYEALGYSFEHLDNHKAKAPAEQVAAASFGPKAQADTQAELAETKERLARLENLLLQQAASKSKGGGKKKKKADEVPAA